MHVAPQEEWGGGVSIENPHVQRARYPQLLLAEWLHRLPRNKGPPITADLAPLWRHVGSLMLDPAVLAEVTHRLVLLQRLYGRQDAGGAGLGADGPEVAMAVGRGPGAGGGVDGGEEADGVGLVRPEDVSRGVPPVWC